MASKLVQRVALACQAIREAHKAGSEHEREALAKMVNRLTRRDIAESLTELVLRENSVGGGHG